MVKILNKGIQKGRDLITNGRIDSHNLQPGDHIFVTRFLHTYSHHGIYLGDHYAIHFLPTEKGISSSQPPCKRCGYRKDKDLGVVKTCLDCFIAENNPLNGHSLHLYQYGVSLVEYKIRRRGTCTTKQASKTPQEVVKTATDLLKTGFGSYDLLLNNCEDFATFCKTGIRSSAQAKFPANATTVAGVPLGAAAVAATNAAALTFISYFEPRAQVEDVSDGEKTT